MEGFELQKEKTRPVDEPGKVENWESRHQKASEEVASRFNRSLDPENVLRYMMEENNSSIDGWEERPH